MINLDLCFFIYFLTMETIVDRKKLVLHVRLY